MTLKNLQIPRICHVAGLVASPGAAVIASSLALAAGPQEQGRRSQKWRGALKHKYSVGETVYFTASNVVRPAASGTYQVIRLLPTDGDDCQYRIKSSTEAFERVAKESQLDVS